MEGKRSALDMHRWYSVSKQYQGNWCMARARSEAWNNKLSLMGYKSREKCFAVTRFTDYRQRTSEQIRATCCTRMEVVAALQANHRNEWCSMLTKQDLRLE